MKLILESWRTFLKEASSNERSFAFTEPELQKLNKSIAKITSAAQKVLGAAGPLPYLTAKDLESRPATPIQQVAEADDISKLRKQYHGPEGELARSGPRSVRGLEKGLGKMSARDFEQAEMVMKVPEEVLVDFRSLIGELKKVDGLFVEARDWYHNIRQLLDEETKNDRDSALLGLLIATYSPRAKFALNLTEAVYMYKAVQEDTKNNPELLKKYLETFPGAEKLKPGQPRGFTNANKVPNFALNLIAPGLSGYRKGDTGNVVYDELYMWNSTIDTWMIDAFYPLLRKSSTSKEWETIKGKLMSNVVSYRYMTNLVAQEAKKLNLLPHELQAIIWVSMQVRQTGEAGLGVTTQFAFNQIKEAITNVNSIKEGLEASKRNLEQNSWLKIILDTIDSKGFKEAAKIALGIKNEKGKIEIPGVRSITSKGKKGTSFKYFTEPEKEKSSTITKKKTTGSSTRPKPEKRFADQAFNELKTHYVMNNIIQMPTGKFNNLYDSVSLYLDPKFSTQKAVEYITGRFDPEARSSKDYFKK